MNYRTLGRTGIKISPLCLGTDNFGNPTPADEATRIIDAALDAGINLIDTADMYGGVTPGASERMIGAALKANGKRDQVILATKFHYPMGPDPNERGNSRRHIIQACDDSLRRLQTDYIDLYQTHRPDFDIPLDETLRRARRPGDTGQGALHWQLHRTGLARDGGHHGKRAESDMCASSPNNLPTTCSTAASRMSLCRCASGTVWA
jgi:aryl-alcohol dehydrogenase-like predicted oxidoreductase